MSGIELFGFAAVTIMVVAYALEDRSPAFVLLFALACLAAASYAVLIHSWPFAAVESVWSVIAWFRWRQRRSRRTPSTTHEGGT